MTNKTISGGEVRKTPDDLRKVLISSSRQLTDKISNIDTSSSSF